jgi:hypothetical protein
VEQGIQYRAGINIAVAVAMDDGDWSPLCCKMRIKRTFILCRGTGRL